MLKLQGQALMRYQSTGVVTVAALVMETEVTVVDMNAEGCRMDILAHLIGPLKVGVAPAMGLAQVIEVRAARSSQSTSGESIIIARM